MTKDIAKKKENVYTTIQIKFVANFWLENVLSKKTAYLNIPESADTG